ncbi:MAG: DNA topoisomerase [Nitrososphaerales archaeon]
MEAALESEGIGTKATRADTISTLFARGYATSHSNVSPTETGLVLIEAMKKYCPSIISPTMTREVEKNINAISTGKLSEIAFLAQVVESLNIVLSQLNANERQLGRDFNISGLSVTREKQPRSRGTYMKQITIGSCPVCKTGSLRSIRSSKTGKRFLGCSNYKSGCKASAPLPKRGILKSADSRCAKCDWPHVLVISGRGAGATWKLCPNLACTARNESGQENKII